MCIYAEDRVLWFRCRASRDRWKEEVVLIQEEFNRLLKGLKAMSDVWSICSLSSRQGAAAYESRRSHTFQSMYEQASVLFQKSIEPYVNRPSPPMKMRKK